MLINGSPHEKGCTYTSLNEVAKVLEENGLEAEIHWIGKGDIVGCRACASCRKIGRCVIDDDVNAVGARVDEFDGFVFGSPVYYAGPAGQLCSWMDRFFYSYGGKMQLKVGANVVNARRGGNTATFERLNQYLLMNHMIVPGSRYWNMTHGTKPEEVEQDIEGMQTVRELGRNIAWILRCVEAGKKAGVPIPEREERQMTNFIR